MFLGIDLEEEILTKYHKGFHGHSQTRMITTRPKFLDEAYVQTYHVEGEKKGGEWESFKQGQGNNQSSKDKE